MGTRMRLWLFLCAVVTTASAALTVVRADLDPATVFNQAADILARNWRYRDALVMYGRAERVASGPEQTRAALGVSSTALRLGEFELAYAKASQMLRAHPDDLDVRTTYGQAAWSAGLFSDAERAFREVLAARPREPRALLGMARVLTARNQVEAGLDHALAAAGAAPMDPDSFYVVAFIYAQMKRLDEAIAAYEKYVERLPAGELDKRKWTQGELRLLRSFRRHVPGQIDPRARGVVHTVPFRLVDDKVLVRARVNGAEWVDFVLDTGAERTVLSQSTARRLGIAPVAETVSAGVGEIGLRGLQHARLDSLQVGSLVIRNVPCLLKTPPLVGLPVGERESFSPLSLGLSLVVDYRRRELLIADDLPEQRHEVALPLWFSRLATVRGTVNGERAASFIVDTGGEVISISQDTARTLSAQPAGRRVPLFVFGTSGRDRDAYVMPGVTVAFDSVRSSSTSVAVFNLRGPSVLLGYRVGGTVGHEFLRNYRVTIDLKRSVLGLSRN